MKLKQYAVIIMALYSFIALTGCANSTTPQYVNELRLSFNETTDITISYDEENITFYESEDDDLVIKEYMTKDKSSYYATVTEHDGSIQISEGDKPFFKGGFLRYVEVYLPISYY